MVWQKEIDEIKYRRQLIEQGGDSKRIKQQRELGKLTIRERIAALADPGSFHEIGGIPGSEIYDGDKLVAMMPLPQIIGWCTLDGGKVVITGHDYAVRIDMHDHESLFSRWSFAYGETLALKWRMPCIRLLDAPGASVKMYEAMGRPEFVNINHWIEVSARLLREVPVVSAVMGPIGGMPAIESNLCHFNVIVKGIGYTFPGGPPAVKAALGYDIDKEELGGWQISTNTGVIDNVADNEEEAFHLIRRFLGYMPDNVWEMPPRIETDDDPNRRDEELLAIIPRERNRPYNPYEILNRVLDHDSLFEIAPLYGQSRTTALARVNGYPMGVIISNPMSPSAEYMDVTASEKVIRLLQLCDTFHLPLVCFIDEPGFMASLDSEKKGIVRSGARLVQAIHQTKMPWISFIIRHVDGVSSSLAFRPGGMSELYAWPSATVGSMRIKEGAVPSYRLHRAFGIQDIIDPRDTRSILCNFIENAQRILKTQLGAGTGPAYRL